jgi:hypothetical protein
MLPEAVAVSCHALRQVLSVIGKGIGLAAATSPAVHACRDGLTAAAKSIAGVSREPAAQDEDFWFRAQQAFTLGRGIINRNNGGGTSIATQRDRSAGALHLAAGRSRGPHEAANGAPAPFILKATPLDILGG